MGEYFAGVWGIVLQLKARIRDVETPAFAGVTGKDLPSSPLCSLCPCGEKEPSSPPLRTLRLCVKVFLRLCAETLPCTSPPLCRIICPFVE